MENLTLQANKEDAGTRVDALANIVFPTPGMPQSSNPLGIEAPLER